MNLSVDELLAEALLHFDAAADYVTVGDIDDRIVADAVCMRLYAGLEALTRLPGEVADDLFSEDWPAMRAMRHRIAHGYRILSLERVRETVKSELPGAITSIRTALA